MQQLMLSGTREAPPQPWQCHPVRTVLASMPQSAAKRYKLTGSGKVMVRRAGKQHLNEKQSRKTKRNLR
jgi:hypothetical protein